MRQLYLTFKNCATVWHKLSWSHLKIILPIKEESKRNYYINLAVQNTLTVRKLINEIRKEFHNKTIGIIICKKNDRNITKYHKNNNILVTSYKIKK